MIKFSRRRRCFIYLYFYDKIANLPIRRELSGDAGPCTVALRTVRSDLQTNLGISTNLRTPEEERNYPEPMNSNISIANVRRDVLLKERDKIRQESLIALRNGDVRKVAQLTTQTAQINQILNQLEF